jgi:G:T-mismatch repair DNA endonuclease (very short patch repair protein)
MTRKLTGSYVLCNKCGELVYKTRTELIYKNHFCSDECFYAYPRDSKKVEVLCKDCGKSFKVYPYRLKKGLPFHCNSCYGNSGISCICPTCNKVFSVERWKYHTLKDKQSFYCSNECVARDPKNKEISRKTAINNAKTGLYDYTKGPSSPELNLLKIIEKYRLPYKYTGNGSFWIKRNNPDFVNINGDKLAIEVQGCYWHNCSKCYSNGKGYKGNIGHDRDKRLVYSEFGWRVINIWEHELKNKNLEIKLKNKILNFGVHKL